MGKARNTIVGVVLVVCAVVYIAIAQNQDSKTRSFQIVSSDTFPAFQAIKPNQTSSGNNFIELSDGTNLLFFINSAGGLGLKLTPTNFVGGLVYTNLTGKNIELNVQGSWTTAAVSGYAGVTPATNRSSS